MSQHSFSIANMTRTLFRAAVNDALQALASNNKGSAAPSTKYVGMTWIDDAATPWIEKRWDGADWIVSGYINASTNLWTPAGADPIAAGIVVEYHGATAPSGWLFPYGQAVSRTTYAALFAAIGTTHGVGDGSTTFNLPDRRGRVGIGRDDMGGAAASRITTAAGGINGASLGATGGAQSSTALIAHTHGESTVGSVSTSSADNNFSGSTTTVVTGVSGAGGSTGSAGSGTSFPILPPGIVCNFIIKT